MKYSHASKGDLIEACVQSRKSYEAEQGGSSVQEKVLNVDRKADNPKEAEKLAKGALQKANAKEESTTIEIMGCPKLVAGLTVKLEGFGAFSGQYFIEKSEHKFSSSGYTTSLTLNKARLKPDVLLTATQTAITKRETSGNKTSNVTETIAAAQKTISAFNSVKNRLEVTTQGSDDESDTNLLLCLPDIAEAISGRLSAAGAVQDSKGWEYLSEMFKLWLSTKTIKDFDEVDVNSPNLKDEHRKLLAQRAFFPNRLGLGYVL